MAPTRALLILVAALITMMIAVLAPMHVTGGVSVAWWGNLTGTAGVLSPLSVPPSTDDGPTSPRESREGMPNASTTPKAASEAPARPRGPVGGESLGVDPATMTMEEVMAGLARSCQEQQRPLASDCLAIRGGIFGDNALWVPLLDNPGVLRSITSVGATSERATALPPLDRHAEQTLVNHLRARADLEAAVLRGPRKKAAVPVALDIRGLPAAFPFTGFHRNHLKPLAIHWLNATTRDLPAAIAAHRSVRHVAIVEATGPAYYQGLVSGGFFTNVWHTFGDFFTLLFHTIGPLLLRSNKQVPLTWVTRTPQYTQGRGCAKAADCQTYTLFKPFADAFQRRILFLDDAASMSVTGDVQHIPARQRTAEAASADTATARGPLFVAFPVVLLGLKNRCSPIPETGVDTPECHRNLLQMRNYFLQDLIGVDPHRRACTSATMPASSSSTGPSNGCVRPLVHVMSRQRDKFRHLTPHAETMAAIRAVAAAHPAHPTVLDVVLHGGVSFRDQVLSVYNSTMLVAGRGGGTALAMFLPLGGAYLSISGYDRWNPFRDLHPRWYHFAHHTVALVHHADHRKEPQHFSAGGGKKYVDPNRAAYLVQPQRVASTFKDLLDKMEVANLSFT